MKKKAAEFTRLHHEDQKIIYKKKERNSKQYLDIVGVKNRSKMVLMEDTASREKRCLELLKNANVEKASRTLSQMSSEVDKFADQVSFVYSFPLCYRLNSYRLEKVQIRTKLLFLSIGVRLNVWKQLLPREKRLQKLNWIT